MSDFDDDEDLLALAGDAESAPASPEETPKKKRKMEEPEKSPSPEQEPYPLEGKYKDYADKARIEAMDEMAKEELLYERAQETNAYHERLYLTQRAAREKNQVQEERLSRLKKVKALTRLAKLLKLSELKKQRDKKARRDAGDLYSDDLDGYNPEEPEDDYDPDALDDDNEYGRDEYEEDDYSPEEELWGRNKRSTPPRETSLADINKIRVGRAQVAKFLYYPEFEDVVKNCYARFNVGQNKATGQATYRMVRILLIEEGRRPYKLEGSYVKMFAVCTVGKGAPKKVSMDFFSNLPLTQREWDTYKLYGGETPLSKTVDRKFEALKEMAERVLTLQEVKQMAQRKQELNRDYVGANAVIMRTELMSKLEVARQQENKPEIERLERELEKYTNARKKQADRYSQYDKLSTLDRVNERNRKRNQDAIRRAELIAQERRKQDAIAMAKGGATSNPFARLKTNVRLYYQNVQQEQAEKHKQEVEEREAKKEEVVEGARYRQVGGLEKVISEVNVVF